jgi:hypothetical protein
MHGYVHVKAGREGEQCRIFIDIANGIVRRGSPLARSANKLLSHVGRTREDMGGAPSDDIL